MIKIIAALLCLLPLSITAHPDSLSWQTTANNMSDERWAPAACVFPNGYAAMIAGGYSYAKGVCVTSIDRFNELANRFYPSKAQLTVPRDFAQANLLSNGTILISGGFNDQLGSLNTAEIYDPSADTCVPLNSPMNQRRELFQALNLSDGTVLLIGGLDLVEARGTVAGAEIYHPDTQTFTPTIGTMATDRFGHAACLLQNGKVFVVGGAHWDIRKQETKILDSAEIYDIKTQTFHTSAGRLDIPRDRPTATLLPGGQVLVYGGQGPNGAPVTTAELFDPATEQFTLINLPAQTPRMAHNATAVVPTFVVVTSGWDATAKATTATSVFYNSLTNTTRSLPDLPFAGHDAAQLVFADTRVLVAGGKTVDETAAGSTDRGTTLMLVP